MSDVILVAIITGVIAATTTIVVALINHNGHKLDQIHVLVNSNLAAINAQLTTALMEIGNLEGRLEVALKEVDTLKATPPPATGPSTSLEV